MREHHGGDGQSALTAFQIAVSRLFFALPAAERFLLAGGAALLAQHLTDRATQDLDFFTGTPGDVVAVKGELEVAASKRGWSVETIQATDTFCRLVVHGPEDLLVDIALDAPPMHPSSASFIGPTFAPEELAGRKLLALFDRAAARDFADVFALSATFDKEDLLSRAAALDAGFSSGVLAAQMRTLERFRDADLPVQPGRVAEVRAFFASWRNDLRD